MTPRRARSKVVSRARAREYAREAREVLEGAKHAHERKDVRIAALGAVNACVRASDSLCISALGEHAQGEDHAHAVEVLQRVPDGQELAAKLRLALQYKTQWSYGVARVSLTELTKVLRAAEVLVRAAEARA